MPLRIAAKTLMMPPRKRLPPLITRRPKAKLRDDYGPGGIIEQKIVIHSSISMNRAL
jgi:hypothetical protein